MDQYRSPLLNLPRQFALDPVSQLATVDPISECPLHTNGQATVAPEVLEPTELENPS